MAVTHRLMHPRARVQPQRLAAAPGSTVPPRWPSWTSWWVAHRRASARDRTSGSPARSTPARPSPTGCGRVPAQCPARGTS